MLPRNFPQRQNKRRMLAIRRLYTNSGDSKLTQEERNELIRATEANLIANGRAVRTKKDRTGFARFGR